MIQVTFRPIDVWPGEFGRGRRVSPFRSGYSDTLELLDRELRHLGARNVVIQLALSDSQIRLDGLPRAHATPEHPGVILALESRHGPLKYPCDTFHRWQDNLRAIALALEALRKVDRYGVTKRGEQYRGWAALPSGRDALIARGHELIRQHGGETAALRATHPDHGGDVDDFHAVQAARGRA